MNNNKLVKSKKKNDFKIKMKEKFNSSEVLKSMNNKYIIKSNKIKKFIPDKEKLNKKIEKSLDKNKSSKTSKKNMFREKINMDSVKSDKQEETIKIKNHTTINVEQQRESSVKINKNNVCFKNSFIPYQIKKQISPISSYLNLNTSNNNNNSNNDMVNLYKVKDLV